MNTYEFFNRYFGRHLVEQQGKPYEAAARALTASHRLASGRKSRLSSGWAIVKPQGATMQLRLAASGINYDNRTRTQAFAFELEHWAQTPTLFMVFDKKPLSIAHLFVTVDLRAVRICTPAGVQTFNYKQNPSELSPHYHRLLFKKGIKNAS